MTVLVIARYSKTKGLIYISGCLLLCAVGAWLMYRSPTEGSLEGLHIDPGKFAFFWFGVAAGLVLIWQQSVLLRQIFWHDCAAIWQAGGDINYFDTYRSTLAAKIEVRSIEKISASVPDFLGRRRIVVSLRNGTEASISTWLLDEPFEVAIERFTRSVRLQVTTILS